MDAKLSLTPHELQLLVTIVSERSEKVGKSLTWNELVQEWGTFVGGVEKGYQDNFQQYMKDISVRSQIEEVLRKAPEPLTSKLAAQVRPFDDRFHASTRDLHQPLSAGMTKWASPWWTRIPKKLLGELESDLRAEGIIKNS